MRLGATRITTLLKSSARTSRLCLTLPPATTLINHRHYATAKTMTTAGPGPLEPLGDVTQLAPHITRILGQNPSIMTLQGTNSYLIQPASSKEAPIILIDTSTPDHTDPYVALVMEHLRNQAGSGKLPPVEHVVLTHRHQDHVGAVPGLLKALAAAGLSPPKIWKLPSPDNAVLAASGNRHDMATTDEAIGKTFTEAGGFVPGEDGPIHWLAEGTVVSVVDPAYAGEADVPADGKASVEVVPTPGHTDDSVSLIVTGDGGEADGPAVLTGDTVLGQGTTIFHDFAAYMASLKKLLDLKPRIIYPAHGPHIIGKDKSHELLSMYIKHRQEREDTIIDALRALQEKPGSLGVKLDEIRELDAGRFKAKMKEAGHPNPPEEAWHTTSIASSFPADSKASPMFLLCRVVYGTGYEPLIMAASRTMGSHLVKLESEGRARRVPSKFPKLKGWVVDGTEEVDGWELVEPVAPEGRL